MSTTLDSITIGIDEVGRGCLLGPLVVAAVANPLGWRHADVKDSKQVSSEKKRHLLAQLIATNTMWSMSSAPATAINELGIGPTLEQTCICVLTDLTRRVRERCPGVPQRIILDGQMMYGILKLFHKPPHCTVDAMPQADAKVFESSCASLIAKSSRDRWCRDILVVRPELAVFHPATNKGYDSPNHTQAMIDKGLTDLHRIQFCRTRLQNEAAKRKQEIVLQLPDGNRELIKNLNKE